MKLDLFLLVGIVFGAIWITIHGFRLADEILILVAPFCGWALLAFLSYSLFTL